MNTNQNARNNEDAEVGWKTSELASLPPPAFELNLNILNANGGVIRFMANTSQWASLWLHVTLLLVASNCRL